MTCCSTARSSSAIRAILNMVTVPILPALKVALDELQARRITPTFLINQYGATRTEGGLSTMFIQWRGKAAYRMTCTPTGFAKPSAG